MLTLACGDRVIRFVDLGNQLSGGDGCEPDNWIAFAFWNTVVDEFVSIDGRFAFQSLEDFNNYAATSTLEPEFLDRLRSHIPEKFFDPVMCPTCGAIS